MRLTIRDMKDSHRVWRPEAMEVADVTGNLLPGPVLPCSAEGVWRFTGLCRREPAWRLSLSLRASPPERAPVAKRWTTGRLEIPPAGSGGRGSVAWEDRSGRLLVYDLALVHAAGDAPPRVGVRRSAAASNAWETIVMTRVVTAGASLRLEGVVDQDGRLVPDAKLNGPRVDNWWQLPDSVRHYRRYRLRLTVPAGTRHIRLRLIESREQTVRFVIKPP
jgi:hypothetical protein